MNEQLDAPDQPPRPLSELVDEWLRDERRRLRPKTISTYRDYLDRFVAHTKDGDASSLTIATAIEWRSTLAYSEHVARLGTDALRTFAKWCWRKAYRRDPLTGQSVLAGLDRSKATSRKRQPLSDQTLEAVWIALSERKGNDRLRGIAYARLVYETTERSADIGTLLRRNLDTQSRWIRYTVHRKGGEVLRRVRLSRACVAAVDAYLKSTERARATETPEHIFVERDGSSFAVGGFATWVARLTKDVRRLTGLPWSPGDMAYTGKIHLSSKIRDADLRRRVSGLLEHESDHDRAINIACTVLEDRVRDKSGGTTHDAQELMRIAFADPPTSPRLKLASKDTEQLGAFNIYRGVYGFYR
ncbi:MAG TPA: TIGR02391 family protein, partial [Candidatus Limnocylindria bacterium]|nr:TIGR02391 family protein [Candidatus Limnocylindria bacterium]